MPWLEQLAEKLYQQEEFANLCLEIIRNLGFDADNPPDLDSESQEGNEDSLSEELEQDYEEQAQSDAMTEGMEEFQEQEGETDLDSILEGDLAEQDDLAPDEPSGGIDKEGKILDTPDYRIYTRQFDEEIAASELHDPAEIERLYEQLSQKLKDLSQVTARLANKLQRQLMAQQKRSWLFDQEEGTLDASRLAGIISNPQNHLVFKREEETRFRHTVVTLLIDSSGSMRGRSITTAAMCADILGRTLERCSVKTEILGFTTRAWRGGQSRELWLAQGKPKNPGRLNDLRHVVYKNADDNWRRSRRNLGLMMKEELLKENIDGEALVWAHNRLAERPENRKILMVISDGLPVDNATLLVNPSNCLEEHLKYAIELIEQKSSIELVAIGIGHDVTHHYQRAVTINNPEDLSGAITDQLGDLFARQ